MKIITYFFENHLKSITFDNYKYVYALIYYSHLVRACKISFRVRDILVYLINFNEKPTHCAFILPVSGIERNFSIA